ELNQTPRVIFSRNLDDLICCTFRGGFSCNRTASLLIDKIGFPYLSSVLWQSGLFHHRRGGLWLQGFYPMKKDCPQSCGQSTQKCNDVFKFREQLSSRPVIVKPSLIRQPSISSQNITALSAATYLTLLAQGQLVSADASRRIRDVLSRACTFF